MKIRNRGHYLLLMGLLFCGCMLNPNFILAANINTDNANAKTSAAKAGSSPGAKNNTSNTRMGSGSSASIIANEESQPAQVLVDIYDPPIPFIALDKFYLTYELYLTNFYNSEITLDAIQIHDKDTDTPLLGFDKKALAKMIRNTCPDNSACDNLIIPPGGMKLVYLLLPFNSQNDLPKDIIQRVFVTKKDDGAQAELKTLPLKVNKTITVMVRPPVKGDYWVAMNGLGTMSPHRLAHWVMNGQNYFAQRYAIDFMQIDLDGKNFQGNERENASYYAYDKDVSAVARGTVVAVKDGIPDNKPVLTKADENKMGKFNPETAPGNYIILELTKGIYAFYAHLSPGTIKVKVGDKVVEGQTLAKIGNSGDSKLPHLHFHIVDKPAYFAGNGIPYTFTEFWVRPSNVVENGSEKLFKFSNMADGLKRYNNQALLENTVVRFNDEARFNKERKAAFSTNDDDDDREISADVKSVPKGSSAAKSVINENFQQQGVRAESSPNSYRNSNNPNNPNSNSNANMNNGMNPNMNGTRDARQRTSRSTEASGQNRQNRRADPFQGIRKLFGIE